MNGDLINYSRLRGNVGAMYLFIYLSTLKIHKVKLATSKPLETTLKACLMSMKKGEVAWFHVIKTYYKVELVNIRYPKP